MPALQGYTVAAMSPSIRSERNIAGSNMAVIDTCTCAYSCVINRITVSMRRLAPLLKLPFYLFLSNERNYM